MEILYLEMMVVFMTALYDKTRGQRLVIERNLAAVTSPSRLEEIYIEVKDKIPSTYLDNGDSGSLRKGDYKGTLMKSSNPYYFGYDDFDAKYLSGKDTKSDLEDKNAICAGIFNSGFFNWFEEEAVDFSLRAEKTMQQLRKRNPNLYVDIYQNWPSHMDPNEWLNPIRRRDVSAKGKKFSEKVFKCLTRKKHSEEDSFREYFISAVYQSDMKTNRMDGRFIFSVNENGELRLFAMAEETGKVDKEMLEKINLEYYERGYSSYDVRTTDVCKLSLDDKIRLCSMVLNATGFPDQIKFTPSPENIEDECTKRKVVARVKTEVYKSAPFPRTDDKYEEEYEINYDDKMISCKGINDHAMGPPFFKYDTYYISRGLFHKSAVVFKPAMNSNLYSAYVGVTNVCLIDGPGEIKYLSSSKLINSRLLY